MGTGIGEGQKKDKRTQRREGSGATKKGTREATREVTMYRGHTGSSKEQTKWWCGFFERADLVLKRALRNSRLSAQQLNATADLGGLRALQNSRPLCLMPARTPLSQLVPCTRTVTIYRDRPLQALVPNHHLFSFAFLARGYFHNIHPSMNTFQIDQ